MHNEVLVPRCGVSFWFLAAEDPDRAELGQPVFESFMISHVLFCYDRDQARLYQLRLSTRDRLDCRQEWPLSHDMVDQETDCSSLRWEIAA